MNIPILTIFITIAIAGYLFALIPNLRYAYWANQMPTALFPDLDLDCYSPLQKAKRARCIKKLLFWSKISDNYYVGYGIFFFAGIISIILWSHGVNVICI